MGIRDPNVTALRPIMNGANPTDPNIPPADVNYPNVPPVFAAYVSADRSYWLRLSPATVNKIFTNLFNDADQTWNSNVLWVWWYRMDLQGVNRTYANGEVPLLPSTNAGSTDSIRTCSCRESAITFDSLNGTFVCPNQGVNYLTQLRTIGENQFPGEDFYVIATNDHMGKVDSCIDGASRVLYLRATRLDSPPLLVGVPQLIPSPNKTSLVVSGVCQPALTSVRNAVLYQFSSSTDPKSWNPSQATASRKLTDAEISKLFFFQPSNSSFTIAFPLSADQQSIISAPIGDGTFFAAMFDLVNSAGATPQMRSATFQTTTPPTPQIPWGMVIGSLAAISILFIGFKMYKSK